MMLRAGSIKAAAIHIRAFMAESFLLPCQSRSCHRPAWPGDPVRRDLSINQGCPGILVPRLRGGWRSEL